MFDISRTRLAQGYRTKPFPPADPQLSESYRGLPALDPGLCRSGCDACAKVCPTDAIHAAAGRPNLDLGRCLFCPECSRACPTGAISFTRQYQLATSSREDLRLEGEALALARSLDERTRKLFGRSLKLRQVSAGGCNACEADVNVLGTVVYDLGRFGIQFVASPRHADGLLVTGPVTHAMREALARTYEATPAPKIVIAVGACAISGGPFAGSPMVHDGIQDSLPVDLYVPGCPPHPLTILDGLLRLLGRLDGAPAVP